METKLNKLSESSSAVAPASAPDLGQEPGEGATFLVKYYEPFEFHGRVFVKEYEGPEGEYITTHGPFYSEQEAMVETIGLTADQIVETYCTP